MEYNCLLNYFYRRIRDTIIQLKGSLVLELQQRSIEFNSILDKHQNIRYVARELLLSYLLALRCSIIMHTCKFQKLMDEFIQVCTG